MRVLVTGSGGNLGRVVVPALEEAGHEVRTMDQRGGDVEGDVRDADAVARAVDGVDAVVHGAALHGVHLDRWSPHDFWATNVTGTFNVYEAARSAAASRIVLCSTMGVYGHAIGEPAVIHDATPVAPSEVYGMSKALCEELARAYTRIGGVVTVALRLGMFVPETFERYGFRLLFGGVDDRDVAQAVVLALGHDPDGGFDAINVMAEVPFGDPFAFADDPGAVVEEHWPGTREQGFAIGDLVWGATIWRSEKAKQLLGWQPKHGFGEFLDAYRRGDTGYYPFAELPQWGV